MSDTSYRPRIEASAGPLVQVYEDGQVIVAPEQSVDTAVRSALGTLSQLARGLAGGDATQPMRDVQVPDREIGHGSEYEWVQTPSGSGSGATIYVGTPEIGGGGLPVPQGVLSPTLSSVSSISLPTFPQATGTAHAAESGTSENRNTTPLVAPAPTLGQSDIKSKVQEEPMPNIFALIFAFIVTCIIFIGLLRLALSCLDRAIQWTIPGLDWLLQSAFSAAGYILNYAMRATVASTFIALREMGMIQYELPCSFMEFIRDTCAWPPLFDTAQMEQWDWNATEMI